jgi:bacteriorhodopsin
MSMVNRRYLSLYFLDFQCIPVDNHRYVLDIPHSPPSSNSTVHIAYLCNYGYTNVDPRYNHGLPSPTLLWSGMCITS